MSSRIRGIDLDRIERAVREILIAIGEDPERDGLQRTPRRVAEMYAEIFAGLHEDPAHHLVTTFEANHDEMVMVRDIPLYSLCEHHLVPFHGLAHVAYIPGADGRITGLSKIARLVDGFAKRPQVQERLTTQIADAIVEALRSERRVRDDRGRTPLHVDARRAQARLADRHVRRSRSLQGQCRHPRRGDVATARRSAESPFGPPGPANRRSAIASVAPSRNPAVTGVPRLTVAELPRRALMGVVNVTPDSFSDGGRFLDPGRRDRARSRPRGRRCGADRRGRRVHATGCRPRRRRRRAPARVCRWCRAWSPKARCP